MVCLGFNPGTQDGSRRRIHWAMASIQHVNLLGTIFNLKDDLRPWADDGGQVVSVLAFYSANPSSNPTEVYN